MADDVIIRAEGLGKKYLIGHQSDERYTTLRDLLARSVKGFARTTRDMLRGKAIVAGDEVEEFWALKDVNFEIKRGDVVGIIGRNGAGKSTLLKVLSRITEPTEGRVTIDGRVASLLEVGTGFHPELTGRENIYLNGAILGMTRAEIRQKFDEIVDFAGVEKFLDTPVKRYSSGMYVRLAFAVAAHLEPEILIVDEVLAVGDAEFQKKCLGKMKDVAGHGRTVVFVSHNMDAVSALCKSGIVMSRGSVILNDLALECIKHYQSEHRSCATESIESYRESRYIYTREFTSISLAGADASVGPTICLSIDFRDDDFREIAIILEDENERPILTTHVSDSLGPMRGPCTHSLEIELPKWAIKSGIYHVTASCFNVSNHQFYDVINHYPVGEILNPVLEPSINVRAGKIHIPIGWKQKTDYDSDS